MEEEDRPRDIPTIRLTSATPSTADLSSQGQRIPTPALERRRPLRVRAQIRRDTEKTSRAEKVQGLPHARRARKGAPGSERERATHVHRRPFFAHRAGV